MAWLLCARLLTSDFPISIGRDGFTATKAIAAAADIRVTAPAMRRRAKTPFRLNQRLVFMYFYIFLYLFLVEVDNCNPVPCGTRNHSHEALLNWRSLRLTRHYSWTWRDRAKRCLSEGSVPAAYSAGPKRR